MNLYILSYSYFFPIPLFLLCSLFTLLKVVCLSLLLLVILMRDCCCTYITCFLKGRSSRAMNLHCMGDCFCHYAISNIMCIIKSIHFLANLNIILFNNITIRFVDFSNLFRIQSKKLESGKGFV